MIPNLIHALVKCSSFPESFFVSNSQGCDDEDMMHKLRLSCQDVTLSLASSSVGVFTIASSLISITGSIAIQESVLCLFRGIVDSIEESLLSLFVDSPFQDDSLNCRITKRADIPTTPVVTKYDEILEYVYQHMNEYTVHPILLSTALQVMFSFDNWTFSRRDLCQHLFTYVLSACSSSPVSLLPRLFQYICRLYESPVLVVTREMIEQILSLSGYIANMEVENVQHDYMQLVATSICYTDENQTLNVLLEVVTPICQSIKSGSDSLSFQMICLTGILDGCLIESLANQIASTVLASLQSVFCSLSQQHSPLLLHVVHVCRAIVRAAHIQLDERNAILILNFCNQLVGVEEFRDQTLEVIEILLNDSFQIIPVEQRLSLFTTINQLYSWNIQNHTVKANIDSIKYIIHIQYVFLKEDKVDVAQQEMLIMITGLLIATIREMVNEEELIRIVIRSLVYLVIVGVSVECDL